MCFYYGWLGDSYGFIDEFDSRRTLPNLIKLTREQHGELLAQSDMGKDIVYYNGRLFAAEPDFYYLDNNKWKKRTTEEVNEIRKARRREELSTYSLTQREVFLALYKDKGITPEQIKEQITDPSALIEFEYAERYYRGNPLIDIIGEQLGYTTEQLDNLFITGSLE